MQDTGETPLVDRVDAAALLDDDVRGQQHIEVVVRRAGGTQVQGIDQVGRGRRALDERADDTEARLGP